MAEDFAIGKALVIPQSVLNNINKLDEKINLIASDSEKMATHFSSAMTRMGGNAGELLAKLTEIQKKINGLDLSKLSNNVSNISGSVTEMEKLADAISKAAQAINKYNSTKGINTSGSNSDEVSKLQKEIEQLKKKTEQLEKYKKKQEEVNKEQSQTRTNNKAIDAYNRAMASSEALVTQRINKIAKLRQAEEMLVKTGKDYSANISKIRSEIQRLNTLNQGQVDAYGRVIKSQHNLMNTSDQLARKLALVFSVSQIEGYVNKLVKVRGEFELQNTALASILQNKDQADKLFSQITDLAVKSPFTVKELTTYTKSLAAYQVQYEDLYDTTKMLADVSAGLGVDMQRLILAFGQVKAANFLRGTETRQFTEAGINMLGELAKYYSELEGRIVSVSEVQDRQFKKMISYQDVEQVFKRLTSEGGMFYEMQERQAETIAGQMSNLQDTIDIMLNDIGKANDSTIRSVISTIKSIIENWEIFANAIKTSGVVFALYYSKIMLASVANGAFAKSTIAATAAQNGLVGATGKAITAIKALVASVKSNPFLVIASAVTMLGLELYDNAKKVEDNRKAYDVFTNSVKKTQAEFNNIAQRISGQNQKIKESSEVLSSVEAGTNEYADAESNANKERQKMNALLEELKTKFPEVYESIVQQKNGTVDLTEAQRLLNEELERTTYLSYLSKQTETFWNDGLVENIKDASDAQQQYKLSSEDLSNAYIQMNSRIKEYFATNKYASKDLQNQLDDISKSSISTSEKIEKMYSVVRNVSGVNIGDLRDIIYDYQDEARKARDANKDLEKSNSSLSESIKQIANGYKLAFDTASEEGRNSAKAATEDFIRLLDIKNEAVRAFVRSQFEITIGVKLDIENKKQPELSDIEKRINSYIDNMDFTLVPKIDAGEGTVKFFNELKEEYKSLTEEAEKIKRASQELYIDQTNVQRLEEINKKMSQVKTTLKDWGELEEEKTKKSKENSELKKLKEQIDLIKKAGDEYEKLRKYYSEDEATRIVGDSFGDAFENLGLDIEMTFDTTGIINGLESLYKSVGDKGKKILDESLAPIRTQQEIEIKAKGVEKIQEQIDDLFAGYELSVELDKMGLDNNLIIQLFDVNTLTLDDVRKNLDKLKAEIGDAGTKYEEVFQKAEKKITEMQQKELEERLKKYASYLEKSVDKISDIKVKAGVDIQYAGSLFSEGKIDANQYANILKEIIAEMNSEISKINVEKFKESSEYIKAMGDLSLYSRNELMKLSEQIQRLISDSAGEIDASDLKAYQDALHNINNQVKELDKPLSNNPFRQLNELKRLQQEFNEEKERYNEILGKRNELEIRLEQAKLQLQALQNQQKQSPNMDFTQQISGAQSNITNLTEQIGNMTGQLNQSQGIMSSLSSKAGSFMGGMSGTMAIIDAIIKGVYQAINATIEMFNEIKSLADSFGADIEEGVWSDLTIAFNTLGEVNEKVMGSWESFKSGDFVGASVKAVGAVFSVIKGINALNDNKREKKIQKQTELVEDLERAYDKLYDTIENGLSISMYSQNSALIKNLTAQIESYQAMIEAERDKKNTDYDRINEWENTIDDIYSQIEELYNNLKLDLVGDFKSISEQLGDAIADAFENGTDAAEAWGESVKEVVADMVKNILVQKLIEPGVQQILDQMFESAMPNTSAASDIKEQIDNLYEQYNSLKPDSGSLNSMLDYQKRKEELENQINQLESQYQAALTASEGEIPNITQDIIDNTLGQLESLGEDVLSNPAWGMLEDLLGSSSGDTMTGLEKGISSITEDTAEVLASITESIRYFTSDSNTVLHNIYNLMINPPVENPFLSELKVQSEQLRLLYGLFNGIIKNVSGSGKAMSVRIV